MMSDIIREGGGSGKEECKGWHSGLLLLWAVFLLAAVLMFAPGYVGALSLQESYRNATCIRVNGTIRFDKCPAGGWSCLECYQDCWRAFSAVSAVPGVSVYKFIGTFFNQNSALANANKDVGMVLGTCYYTDGGKSLRYSMLDPAGFLIAAFILLGFFGLSFVFWSVAVCRDQEAMVAKRQSVFQRLKAMLAVCSGKCRRRSGYAAIEPRSSSVSRHNLDVL